MAPTKHDEWSPLVRVDNHNIGQPALGDLGSNQKDESSWMDRCHLLLVVGSCNICKKTSHEIGDLNNPSFARVFVSSFLVRVCARTQFHQICPWVYGSPSNIPWSCHHCTSTPCSLLITSIESPRTQVHSMSSVIAILILSINASYSATLLELKMHRLYILELLTYEGSNDYPCIGSIEL